MQKETASRDFAEFGSVYKKMDEDTLKRLSAQTQKVSAQRFLSQFTHFSCDTYIEIESGIGVLLVSHDPEMTQYADRIVTLLDGEIISDVKTENKERQGL